MAVTPGLFPEFSNDVHVECVVIGIIFFACIIDKICQSFSYIMHYDIEKEN